MSILPADSPELGKLTDPGPSSVCANNQPALQDLAVFESDLSQASGTLAANQSVNHLSNGHTSLSANNEDCDLGLPEGFLETRRAVSARP